MSPSLKRSQKCVSAMGLLGQRHRHAGGVNHQARHNSWPWRCRTTSAAWSHTKTDCKQALWTIMTMWFSHGGRRCYTQAAPVHVRWHASEGWSTCMGVLNMVSSDKLRWILNYIHILLVMTNYICMNIWCLLILITSNWSTSPHA